MRLLKLSTILFIILAWSFSINAQEKWSLTKCVDYALEHNIQVKQTTLMAESGKANLQQSKAAIYPNLNASVSDAFQFGRSVDPYTNIFSFKLSERVCQRATECR